jgi:hypothetical protein
MTSTGFPEAALVSDDDLELDNTPYGFTSSASFANPSWLAAGSQSASSSCSPFHVLTLPNESRPAK